MSNSDGFKFWVAINGRGELKYGRATEYAREVKADGTHSWIASESGRTFRLWMAVDGSLPAIEVIVFVDGKRVRGTLIEEGEVGKACINGIELPVDGNMHSEGEWKLRKFEFGTITSTDDEDVRDTSTTDIGTIKYEIRRTSKIHLIDSELELASEESTLARREVHEETKKAGLHCTGLGTAKSLYYAERRVYYEVEKMPAEEENPWRRGLIHYRPIEYLQAKGLAAIPRRSRRGAPAEEDSEHEDAQPENHKRKVDEKDEEASESVDMRRLESERRLLAQRIQEDERLRQEEQQRLLEKRVEEDERRQREVQERQERFQRDMQRMEDDLQRLKAERSKPRSKKMKLEYEERLKAIDGQVFEISD